MAERPPQPTPVPEPLGDAGWSAALTRQRRLQAVQVAVLFVLSLAVVAVAAVNGHVTLSELDRYRSIQSGQARLDALRVSLQEQESALWRHRAAGGAGIPVAIAGPALAATAETESIASAELARDPSPAERAAIEATRADLDELVALIATAGRLGRQGSAADRRFIARLEPLADDLRIASDRWRAANTAQLGEAARDAERATQRFVTLTVLSAVVAALSGLAVWLALRGPRRRVTAALRAATGRLRHLADSDPLTGLANHRVLRERLHEEVSAARRDGLPLAVAVIDLDQFKAVNDTFGHAAGDAVLVETARRLRAAVRPTDVIARVGGEELALLMPGLGADEALTLAERARRAVRDGDHPGGVGTVTASAGVAVLAEGDDADSLLERADRALYRAKGEGRDRTRPAADVHPADISLVPGLAGEPVPTRSVR